MDAPRELNGLAETTSLVVELLHELRQHVTAEEYLVFLAILTSWIQREIKLAKRKAA